MFIIRLNHVYVKILPNDKIGWTNQLDLAAKFELNKARKLLVLIYYKLNIYISSHDTINILYVRNK